MRQWTQAQAFAVGRRGSWPRDFSVGYSSGPSPWRFRGYFSDRRVARRMSRRLGVRFRVVRDEPTHYYEMHVSAPHAILAAVLRGVGSL